MRRPCQTLVTFINPDLTLAGCVHGPKAWQWDDRDPCNAAHLCMVLGSVMLGKGLWWLRRVCSVGCAHAAWGLGAWAPSPHVHLCEGDLAQPGKRQRAVEMDFKKWSCGMLLLETVGQGRRCCRGTQLLGVKGRVTARAHKSPHTHNKIGYSRCLYRLACLMCLLRDWGPKQALTGLPKIVHAPQHMPAPHPVSIKEQTEVVVGAPPWHRGHKPLHAWVPGRPSLSALLLTMHQPEWHLLFKALLLLLTRGGVLFQTFNESKERALHGPLHGEAAYKRVFLRRCPLTTTADAHLCRCPLTTMADAHVCRYPSTTTGTLETQGADRKHSQPNMNGARTPSDECSETPHLMQGEPCHKLLPFVQDDNYHRK
eukprot:scaffold97508_cov19-Tisochrysis_lutea.AAC.2